MVRNNLSTVHRVPRSQRLGDRRDLLLAALAVVSLSGCAGFGKRPRGARQARVESSTQWDADEDHFDNPQPLWNNLSVRALFRSMRNGSDHSAPEDTATQLPVQRVDPRLLATPPDSGLRVTWFGHSSLLIELDGVRVLTDPVWGPRSSPVTWMGPKRWYPPPISLEELPEVDAVVISHDHYDHLDYPTFQVLKEWNATFLVPLGVGAHLEYWGVPAERIVELDWWQRHRIAGVELVCTPARHASGRRVFRQNRTLWAGWALLGPTHRAFFSGDTGLFDGMKAIGERLGPFDVTMIEVGAYHKNWPDWHLGPEQAVLAHQWVRGRLMLPVHWGLFDLAFHGWTEPAERVLAAARGAGVAVAVPRPGDSVEPVSPPTPDRWWPQVPWRTAAEDPIVATDANGKPPHRD